MAKSLIPTALVIIAVFVLSACQVEHALPQPPPVVKETNLTASLVVNATCSSVPLPDQSFNVSGFLTAEAPLGDKVFLHVTPDPSYRTVIDVVDHHPSVMETKLVNHTYFGFEVLPPGLYVAGLPAKDFVFNQGFPVITKVTSTNGTVNLSIKWHGGDINHSLLVFSLEPGLPEEEK